MKKITISFIIIVILFASIGALAKKPDNFNFNAGNKNKKPLVIAKKAGVLIPLLFVVKPTANIIKHLFNKKSSAQKNIKILYEVIINAENDAQLNYAVKNVPPGKLRDEAVRINQEKRAFPVPIGSIQNKNSVMTYENKQNIYMNQGVILNRIRKYLEISGVSKECVDKHINTLGYCHGISALWSYSKWLQYKTNASNHANVVDDYNWFQAVIKALLEWDLTKKSLSQEIEIKYPQPDTASNSIVIKSIFAKELERFISYIEILQDPTAYLSQIHQGDIAQCMEYTSYDIKGNVLHQAPKKVFTIAAPMNVHQIEEMLSDSTFLQDGELIMVSCLTHATALFKNGADYYYFDPNCQNGENKYTILQLKELAINIFKSNYWPESSDDTAVALSFSMFSMEKDAPERKNHADLLKKINPIYFCNCKLKESVIDVFSLAVKCGCQECFEYYIDKFESEFNGIEINDLLLHAIANHKDQMAQKLFLKYKTDLSIKISILFVNAIIYDNIYFIKQCLDSDKLSIQEITSGLILTLKYNQIESLDAITSYASLKKIDIDCAIKQAIIKEAVNSSQAAVVEKLLNVAISHKLDISYFTQQEEDGMSLFMYATKYGLVTIMKQILAMEKDDVKQDKIIMQTNKKLQTTLMLAAQAKTSDAISFILNKKKVLIDAQDDKDFTALRYAVVNDNPLVAKTLLESNPSLKIEAEDKTTILDLGLISIKNPEIFLMIFEKSLEQDSDYKLKGYSPFFYALKINATEAVELYMQKGCFDIDQRWGDELYTLLIQAVISQNESAVIALIERGADILIKNRNDLMAINIIILMLKDPKYTETKKVNINILHKLLQKEFELCDQSKKNTNIYDWAVAKYPDLRDLNFVNKEGFMSSHGLHASEVKQEQVSIDEKEKQNNQKDEWY